MLTPEAFRIYAACMYRPTAEKYEKLAGKYLADPAVHCFGYFQNDILLGIIVIRCGEILGIAVENTARSRSIGRSLIEYAQTLYPFLTAETDDDAIGFYRSCGFECTKFERIFPDGVAVRYKCTKNFL